MYSWWMIDPISGGKRKIPKIVSFGRKMGGIWNVWTGFLKMNAPLLSTGIVSRERSGWSHVLVG
jgi:hypothetical protein